MQPWLAETITNQKGFSGPGKIERSFHSKGPSLMAGKCDTRLEQVTLHGHQRRMWGPAYDGAHQARTDNLNSTALQRKAEQDLPLNHPQWVCTLIQGASVLRAPCPRALEAQVKHLDVPSAKPIPCTARTCLMISLLSFQ